MSTIREQLLLHEGIRLFPYLDTVDKVTIGIGRNLSDKGISKEEAYILLDNDIEEVCGQLDTHLPWWSTLDDVRKRVLIDMCFNLGIKGLLGFKNTLEAVKVKDYLSASKGMLASKWAKQVGKRAIRLAEMMRTGNLPEELRG